MQHVLDDILDECSIHSTKMHSVDGRISCLSRLHPKDILESGSKTSQKDFMTFIQKG